MTKKQFKHWLRATQKTPRCPKVFIISCAGLSSYSLAVEFKHKLEPVFLIKQSASFSSLETIKDELKHLGLKCVFLRLYNAYEECGQTLNNPMSCDIKLVLA